MAKLYPPASQLQYTAHKFPLVPHRYVVGAERYIEDRLSRDTIDVNFVYFLTRRFHGNERLEALISETASRGGGGKR